MSVLFAATYPERTWALALYGGMARMLRAPDYPWGETEAEYRQAMARSKALWVTPGGLEESSRRSAPNGGEDEIRALAALMRHSLSPGAEEALDLMNMQIDVRHVLPAIRVPTLVLQAHPAARARPTCPREGGAGR